jgi:hypothetical protein
MVPLDRLVLYFTPSLPGHFRVVVHFKASRGSSQSLRSCGTVRKHSPGRCPLRMQSNRLAPFFRNLLKLGTADGLFDPTRVSILRRPIYAVC